VGDAFLAGDVERTRALAARVLDGPAGRAARAQVLSTLGVLEQYAGSVPRAAELLATAAELADGSQRVWALAELGHTRFRLGDPGQRALAEFARGIALTVGGDPAAGRPLLADVLELLQSPPLRDDPRYLIHLGLAAGFLGDVRDVVALGERRLAATRERGALGVLVPGLALMAAGRAWLGDHAGAVADAGEAAELGEQLGYAADTAVAVEMLAWQSAARGLHDDARRALERARALTDQAGTTSVHAHQAITAAFCALCRGDLAETAALLEARIAADGGLGSLGEPSGSPPPWSRPTWG
jgi:tetratricopeptide (TPR) repeat protein